MLVSGETRLEGRPQDLLQREDFEALFLGAGPSGPARNTVEEENEDR